MPKKNVPCHLAVEAEVEQREQALYEIALAVEQDEDLAEEMSEWSGTLNDGLMSNRQG